VAYHSINNAPAGKVEGFLKDALPDELRRVLIAVTCKNEAL
jgi:hypothetical protein